jgi:hypothetical protein
MTTTLHLKCAFKSDHLGLAILHAHGLTVAKDSTHTDVGAVGTIHIHTQDGETLSQFVSGAEYEAVLAEHAGTEEEAPKPHPRKGK